MRQELIESTRKWRWGAGFGVALLGVVGCESFSGPGGAGMACTAIGCSSGFFVDFSPNSGWPAGDYEFAVTLDDETTTCTGSLPLPACGTSALTCTPAMDVIGIRESGCALPAAEHAFSGVDIREETPMTVQITISRDGSVIADPTWNPAYVTSQPNGEGCEPICTGASETLTVPITP